MNIHKQENIQDTIIEAVDEFRFNIQSTYQFVIESINKLPLEERAAARDFFEEERKAALDSRIENEYQVRLQ